ncbi:MAG: Crp/Fnr family transcriptional regulator [Acidobacteriaceae bacterium]|nr:Crp/Fnr family transcriptional regulator [Acidobacteriaceae bacterium]
MTTPETISATLRSNALFAPLSDSELRAVAARAVLKGFTAGELLFSEGEACTGLHVIVSGKVRIFKSSRTGREQVLAIEGPGASIAELPVFDGGTFPASASTVESSEIIFLSRKDFQAACLENPELALKVLQVVGRRLRRLVGIIEELSFTTLRQRLISWLLREAKSRGQRSGAGLVLDLGVTHQEIASQIGTVRELVSRNMARLQAQGLIQANGAEITIPNTSALEAEQAAEI